jgi:hypothetical protein
MLRVTVELVPHGDESRARHLGTAVIANDGTGDLDTGNYWAKLSKWGSGATWKRGKYKGFPRKRRGPWDLLYCLLREIVGERNPL